MNRFVGGGGRLEMLAASRSWRAGVALVLICLTVYLPGLFTIPPIDRDESRFAQASRQMFEAAAFKGTPQWREDFHGGGWVVPHVQDRPRLNKPPLVYWLQVASAWAFTGGDPLKDAIWMYRVPGVLCAIASVLLTWRMGLRMFDPRAAWLAAVFLAVCPVVVFDAHQARADQLLLTLTIGTMWALWEVVNRSMNPGRKGGVTPNPHPKSWVWLMFWLLLGLSILAKGPITPMIAALTCLAISLATRSWRWMLRLKPLAGLVIVAAIVGPWVYAVGEHVGWGKYLAIVSDETVGRSLEPKEGHWGPPGYHTVLLAVLFWPGSLTTAMAVVNAWKKARGSGGGGGWRRAWSGRHAELFLLAWIVPAWVVFELVGTKLPHYTLPMYPAIALLSARTLLGLRASAIKAIDRLGYWVWLLLGCAFAFIPVVGTVFLPASGSGDSQHNLLVMFTTPLCATGFLLAVWSYTNFRRGSMFRGAIIAIGSAATYAIALLGLYIPATPAIWTVERLLQRVRQVDPEMARPIASVGFWEDSLVFGTRGNVSRLDLFQLQDWARRHSRGFVIQNEPAPLDPAMMPVATSKRALLGYNYANGRIIHLRLLEVNEE